MRTIKDIIIHHSSGTESNPRASTQHHTAKTISDWHKKLWDFPSIIIKNSARYSGYNFIYEPLTGKLTQCRAIGEETAACIGKNLDSVHLCIVGNYDKGIDILSDKNKKDIQEFLKKLISGSHDFVIYPLIKIDLSSDRIYPHRIFTGI